MLFPSLGGFMLKNTEANFCFVLFSHHFSDRSYGKFVSYYFSTNFPIVPMAACDIVVRFW